MKLIDLLVKELPKRGGWPEGALNATQDKDGEVCFSSSATLEFGFAAWEGGDWCGNEFYTTRATDYDTAIITRDQYEAALAASKAVVGHNGWIEWHGGKCPVDSDAIVEVKYRTPSPYQFNNDRAGDFTWSHDGFGGDIIAYRLRDHDINHRANDDRLEQDLNECIGHGADTAWNGEGLPPVGCKCEVSVDGGHTWCSYKALNEKNGMRLVEIGNFTEDFQSNNWTFRPMRTEADKKRDEAIKGMTSVIDYRNGCSSKPMAGWLYDAIAAGKIPGVRLEGK